MHIHIVPLSCTTSHPLPCINHVYSSNIIRHHQTSSDIIKPTNIGNAWSALLRYAMLAEQGCAVAVENYAWLAERIQPVPPINPVQPEGGCLVPPVWWGSIVEGNGVVNDVVNDVVNSQQDIEMVVNDGEDMGSGLHGEAGDGGGEDMEDGGSEGDSLATTATPTTPAAAADDDDYSNNKNNVSPTTTPPHPSHPTTQPPPRRKKLPQSFRVPSFWTARGVSARWLQRVFVLRLRAARMGLVEGWVDAAHMLCQGEALGLVGGMCWVCGGLCVWECVWRDVYTWGMCVWECVMCCTNIIVYSCVYHHHTYTQVPTSHVQRIYTPQQQQQGALKPCVHLGGCIHKAIHKAAAAVVVVVVGMGIVVSVVVVKLLVVVKQVVIAHTTITTTNNIYHATPPWPSIGIVLHSPAHLPWHMQHQPSLAWFGWWS